MVCGDVKFLIRKTAPVTVLRGEAFGIVKNWKYDGYLKVLTSMVYILLDKKYTLLTRSDILASLDKSASDGAVESKIMLNQELTKELEIPSL